MKDRRGLAEGVIRGATPDPNPQRRHVRREDEIAERFLPCGFAAREDRRSDRQICFGGSVGGTQVPHAVTVQSTTEQLLKYSQNTQTC